MICFLSLLEACKNFTFSLAFWNLITICAGMSLFLLLNSFFMEHILYSFWTSWSFIIVCSLLLPISFSFYSSFREVSSTTSPLAEGPHKENEPSSCSCAWQTIWSFPGTARGAGEEHPRTRPLTLLDREGYPQETEGLSGNVGHEPYPHQPLTAEEEEGQGGQQEGKSITHGYVLPGEHWAIALITASEVVPLPYSFGKPR